MKKTILFLALTAPLFVQAQSLPPPLLRLPGLHGPEENPSAKAQKSAPKSVAVKVADAKEPEAEEVDAPADDLSSRSATPVSYAELLQAGFEIKFLDKSPEYIRLESKKSIPEVCLSRLSFGETEWLSRASKSKSDEGAQYASKSELADYTGVAKQEVVYMSAGAEDTLLECILRAPADAAKKSTAGDARFSHRLTVNPEMLVVQLGDDSKAMIKSPEFVKEEKLLSKVDCSDCNSDSKRRMETMASIKNNPMYTSWIEKLVDDSLKGMDEKIKVSKNIRELTLAQKQLNELLGYASESQKVKMLALFEAVILRNDALTHAGDITYIDASKHLDFKIKSLEEFAQLSGHKEGVQDAVNEQVAALKEKESPTRLKYFLEVDPDHPEMKEYVDKAASLEQDLFVTARMECLNSPNSTRCNKAKMDLQSFRLSHQVIRTAYNAAALKNEQKLYGEAPKVGMFQQSAGAPQFNAFQNSNVNLTQNSAVNPQSIVYGNFNANALYGMPAQQNAQPNPWQQNGWQQFPLYAQPGVIR